MYRALIIDDEAPVRIAVQKLGNWEKYNINQLQFAVNGATALEIMRISPPHIVFVDMQMPVMSGENFLEIASREFPQTRFIVISGYDSFQYAKIALKAGAIDYLLKPVSGIELNQAIEKAVSTLSPITSDSVSLPDSEKSNRLPPEEIVQLIHDDIDLRYAENLKVGDYAIKYFFTKEYLTRQFRSRYGMSIQEYLLQVRMHHARALLLDSSLKIQEIGARVGYNDNNYFSKAFRSFFGESPRECREKK